MRYLSILSQLSRSFFATVVILSLSQTVQLPISAAHDTDIGRMIDQSQGRTQAFKIRPHFDPKIERPEDPPLLNAVRRNEMPMVRKLIESSAKINTANNQQFTPLIVAILLGHDEVAQKLIEAGADVNFPDKPMTVEYQPLWARKGFDNIKPKAFRSQSRSVKRSTNRKSTISLDPISPLRCAIDKSNEALAILLIENGAVFNAIESKDEGSDYSLQKCLSTGLYKAAARILERSTGDQRQETIDSLLIWSIRSADDKIKIPIMRFLIERGAKFEIFDMRGTTPLVTAVIDWDYEIVSFLLDEGAQVDTPVKTMEKYQDAGTTPIAFATMKYAFDSRSKNLEPNILRLLLSRGADANCKNQYGESAVHNLSVNADGIELLQLFYEHGADLDQQDARGNTLLNEALDKKSLDVAEFLLATGADINSNRISINGYIYCNDDVMIDFLLAHNFDLNKQKKDMFSRELPLPLIYACKKGRVEYAKKLIAHGANVNPVSDQDDVPLFVAIRFGGLEIVKILVENGADINYKGREGANAYVMASASGRKDIAAYLKSQGADTSGWRNGEITPIKGPPPG